MRARAFSWLPLFLAGASLGSASGLAAQQAELTWPAAPEQARVRYVGALSSEADVGKKESLLRRLRRLMVGGGREGVLRVQRPFDVSPGLDSRLFVSDGLTQALLLFDRTRKEARLAGLDVPGGLAKPMGIGASGNGGVVVADQQARRMVQLDGEGRYLRSFGGPLQLLNPVDAAVDTTAHLYYVVDSYLHQVLVFDAQGQLVRRLGRQRGDVAAAGQGRPVDSATVARHPGGLDAGAVRTRDVFENRGEGHGEFKYPASVAVAGDGTVYVSDQMNFRVQAFSREGKFLRQIGQMGVHPGSFARPKGIGLDRDGHLYTVDAAFNNIQIFNPAGQLLLSFGRGGQGPGEQILPIGVAVDGQDRIYVADRFNNRIQIYALVP
jgi:hypothetical protein